MSRVYAETTCLLAPSTLEAFCLCFLLPGAERFEQVFFFDFLVGRAPFLGHHFLARMSATASERRETVPRSSFC